MHSSVLSIVPALDASRRGCFSHALSQFQKVPSGELSQLRVCDILKVLLCLASGLEEAFRGTWVSARTLSKQPLGAGPRLPMNESAPGANSAQRPGARTRGCGLELAQGEA